MRTFLPNNNARMHCSQQEVQMVKRLKLTVVAHPPQSPNLAPHFQMYIRNNKKETTREGSSVIEERLYHQCFTYTLEKLACYCLSIQYIGYFLYRFIVYSKKKKIF